MLIIKIKNKEILKFHKATPKNLAITPDLKSANSRHYEFSQTWRCYPRIRHTFNSGRYNFHQNPPSELKVMIDFPKIKYKYVATILFHVSPRCSVILMYENENLRLCKPCAINFRGEAPFKELSPRQGRQK